VAAPYKSAGHIEPCNQRILYMYIPHIHPKLVACCSCGGAGAVVNYESIQFLYHQRKV